MESDNNKLNRDCVSSKRCMNFPKCFPGNFVKEILPISENEFVKIEVYRVIKSGTINREAFLSTYEEEKLGLIPIKDDRDYDDCITYSTSCHYDFKYAKKIGKMLMKHHPQSVIAKGKAAVCCGPSQVTKDREKERKDSHVDWWIYEGVNPEHYFREVENDEERRVL